MPTLFCQVSNPLGNPLPADIVPSLSNPKEIHCNSCQVIVAKNVDTATSDSAKIRKIVELVTAIEERSGGTEKIIIFSQFTSMLGLIQEVLDERGLKFVQCESQSRSRGNDFTQMWQYRRWFNEPERTPEGRGSDQDRQKYENHSHVIQGRRCR